MWQLTSTPFQDTTRHTTCSTLSPQNLGTEHTTLTVLPPSTAPWKALGHCWGPYWSEGRTLPDTVSKLVDGCTEKGIRIGVLTVDREFFSTGVIDVLKSKNIQFLMPATQTKGVKKAIDEFKTGKRDAVSQHVLTSSGAGKRREEFTLIILERDDKKGRKIIHAFATSIPVDVVCGFKRGEMTGAEAFVEQYRARWSIETGYRCMESIRPRTTGREESVRVLLLFAPIILFNAWILASHLLQGADAGKAKTKMTINMVLESFMLLVRKKMCPSLLAP